MSPGLPAPALARPTAAAKGPSTVSILIVDDTASKRLALKSVLAPLGHTIVEADSGVAALRRVMAQDFAVILLDVRMPGMDGFETAALIRLRWQSEMTPIIFITAFTPDEVMPTDRYAEGAVDFIFAPVQPDELRAKVSVFANLFLKAQALAVQAQEVEAYSNQLRMLTDVAPIGIFLTDRHNRYIYTNPRWTEICGLPAEAAIGRRWDSIDSGRPAGHSAEPSAGAGAMGEISHRFELRQPGAEPQIVLVTSRSMLDAAGEPAGWVGTLADITTEAGAEAAMSEARDQANEASRLKSDFLANMSHEVRTPMNGVIGMTDLLLETDLDLRQRDYAQTVRNSAEALLTIIDDVLDFSKVEAGKMELEELEFDVRAIVDDVADLLARSAQSKDLELVTSVALSVPPLVTGDPGRVRQVLTNLVGNAIKFTRTGEIIVSVTEAVVAADHTLIRFEVSDTGSGIAPDKLDTVFQPFVQADASMTRRHGGTGLGLSISSQLVALMGGECGVRSQQEAGSTFWFTIRVQTRPAARDASPTDPALAGVSALIVDDNAAQRSVLSRYLTEWGMTVITADSGKAALATLRTAAIHGRPVAVALVDQVMPRMDGVECKKAIVLDPSLATRVVLMTSLGRERDLGDGEADPDVGASLSKPVHREGLRTALRVALGAEVALPATTKARMPSLAADPSLGRLLLVEDHPINQKVAAAMLSSSGYRVDCALNGAEAVKAVEDQRYEAILMDCQMPEMNGYEATAAIRALEGSGRRTPIIAMTAGARREDRERCLAEGMDSYLAKPLSKDSLVAAVVKATGDAPPPIAGTTARPEAESAVDPFILDELRALGAASGQDLLTEVIEEFSQLSDSLLGELREAMNAGDAAAVARIAHSLKGSAAQVGGWRLALGCDRLVGGGAGWVDLQAVEAEYRALREALTEHRSPVVPPSGPPLRA